MTLKQKIIDYIKDNYNVEPDFPWEGEPDYLVLRHKSNKKWFALIMTVKKCRLGLEGSDMIDVINLKGDKAVNGSLQLTNGILPAYHMNKQIWITVLLDGIVDEELVYELVDMSFENTKNKSC